MNTIPMNAERPFVVGTGAADPWSRKFAEAAAADLLAGRFSLWKTDPEHEPVPVTTGRFLRDETPRVRIAGTKPTTHRYLLDWRSEETLLGLCGLEADEDGTHRLTGTDTIVAHDAAVAIVAETAARIIATALLAKSRDAEEQRSMVAMLTAAAVSCGDVPGRDDVVTATAAGVSCASVPGRDGIVVATAPSPWGPACVRSVRPESSSNLILDPMIDAMLPCAVSVTASEQDDGEPIIRVDAFSASTSWSGTPSIVEAMRTLQQGWTHG